MVSYKFTTMTTTVTKDKSLLMDLRKNTKLAGTTIDSIRNTKEAQHRAASRDSIKETQKRHNTVPLAGRSP